MKAESTGRRPLLKALAGGVVGLGALDVAWRTGVLPGSGDDGGSSPDGLPTLQLSSSSDSGVDSLEVVLGDDLLPAVGRNQWRSPHLPTTVHSMVALTWRDQGRDPHIHVSSRRDGRWETWRRLPTLHDLPDPDSGEGDGVAGTDLTWIGDADGIQIRVTGRRPEDLTLVLLHPGALPGDTTERRITPGGPAFRGKVANPAVPRPAVLTRRDWGADESWRDGKPRYNTTIQQVHIHHTVNSNTYAMADVPALIRGMYRYHTKNLGWSDIAYNFLVDRFGRVWTGRAGGVAKPVRGAHTLGFNATSTGIAVIGNYDLTPPTTATLAAICGVAAWKLDLYGRTPDGRTAVVSEGSDKFARSRTVNLPVIDGHRDTNDTACPGQHLYDALPAIRYQTKLRIDQAGAQTQAVAITTAFTLSGTPGVGQVLTVGAGAFTPPDATAAYTWLRGGAAIPGATASTYAVSAADVGAQLSVRVDVTRAGLQPASATLTASGVVPAVPLASSIAVRAVGRDGKASVHVRVTAPGLTTPVDGQVTVTLRNRTRVIDLVGGRGRTKFRDVRPGSFPVTVSYAGTAAVQPATGSATVVVA